MQKPVLLSCLLVVTGCQASKDAYDTSVEWVSEHPTTSLSTATAATIGSTIGLVLDAGSLVTLGFTAGFASIGYLYGSQIDAEAAMHRWRIFVDESKPIGKTRRAKNKDGVVLATRMLHKPTGWEWDWVRQIGHPEGSKPPPVLGDWIVWQGENAPPAEAMP